MIKLISELISPGLKSNAHYEYTHTNEKLTCKICGKLHRRGMIHKESGDFIGAKCYVTHIGSELKVTFNKRTVALVGVGLAMFFLVNVGFSIYLILPTKKASENIRFQEALVEFFYPWTDKAVSKDIITLQIETIMQSKYPELALAIWFRESRGNPGAVSTANCRGPFQVLAGRDNKGGWVPRLIEDGIIPDARGLHSPLYGCRAGTAVLGYHMTRANGDLMAALRDYVGSKAQANEVSYVRDVLATYGNIQLLKLAAEKHQLEPKNIDRWWAFPDPEKISKKITPYKKGKP